VRRREFITLIGSAAAASPLRARAQQQVMPVVGFLHVGSREAFSHVATAFRRGLREADFVEGGNVVVAQRWAEGQLDRVSALATELMSQPVAVFAGPRQAAQAAKSTGATIPIVFVTGEDPVKLGFVKSLNRPAGNMTGVYFFTNDLEAKRLGLLRDVLPQATTFAVLLDSAVSIADAQERDAQSAASRLGVRLVVVRANSDRDIEAAFATFVEQRASGLLICASPFFNNKRDLLVVLAARHKLPAVSEWREYAAAGGLVSYGNSITDSYRQAGVYAGRILKGAQPADLPVIQPSKFELVFNLKTAKTLGLNISGNLLTLADEVIE